MTDGSSALFSLLTSLLHGRKIRKKKRKKLEKTKAAIVIQNQLFCLFERIGTAAAALQVAVVRLY